MSEAISNVITLYVNGKKFELKDGKIDPRWTLLQFLRSNGLTGTKLGCGEGGCGACTVMLSNYDHGVGEVRHFSANACLTPVCALDGHAVTTVEGIGGMKQGLHPVQQRISSAHGSQCGFCTPGIVMAIYTQLRSKPQSTPAEIEDALDGNLCRCTGYRPIIDAARSLSNNKGDLSAAGGCCKGAAGGGCPCKEAVSLEDVKVNSANSGCCGGGVCDKKSCNSSESYVAAGESVDDAMLSRGLSEPIFPPTLMRFQPSAFKLSGPTCTWHQPLTLFQLLELKQTYPDARLVVGNTEVGIETKFKAMEYSTLINPSHVPELRVLSVSKEETGITIGSAVTINGLRDFCENLDVEYGKQGRGYATRGLIAIRDMLNWFASNHIRNVACVGGNIVTASPISDLNPMLIACNAVLTVTSKDRGSRQVPMNKFFLSYRKVDLQPDEILESVFVPFTAEFEFVFPFKQARRREDDISIVTSGIRVRLEPIHDENHWKIADCALSYGGMAPTTIHADKTAAALLGKVWTYENIESLFSVLRQELALPETVPGGQAEYRMALTVSFLFKAYLSITVALQTFIDVHCVGKTFPFPAVPVVDNYNNSGTSNFLSEHKPSTRGQQSYTKRDGGMQHARPIPHAPQVESGEHKHQEPKVVGKPLMHINAEAQVCGDAKYTDDVGLPANAVHACLVTSTRAHAKVLSVDIAAAEKCAGFVAYYSHKDVIGDNHIGCVVHDEEVFVEKVARCYGAVIGVIIAESHDEAVYAARKVVIQYEDLPAIISIQDAIAAQSFYPIHHQVTSGDVDKARRESDVVVEGTGNIGGQEHFYLETNVSKVFPLDNGHLEIITSTQNCAEAQKLVASVCGLPSSKVVAKCKRLGGGFGGKESRTAFITCTAALAAVKLNRPVSILIERDVDMSITGQRHAFHFKYSAGCMKDGKLTFLSAELYNNGGFSLDLSQAVMDRALMHSDNAYKFPALHVRGTVCKTNQSSHTAFRGFGGPQGMMLCEYAIEHLASVIGIAAEEIRMKNLYHEGDVTHFGTKLEQYYVPRLMRELQPAADVELRKAQVKEFNRVNRWKKRGLCVLPTKYGINFGAKFMNQGGALVHVYTDGSVLIAQGGTEMGQGLYTKVCQVAAQAFDIPFERVTIAETSTNTVANASPTAASMSTDLYGMAVLDACEQILERLKPVKARMPGAEWNQIINAAFFDRINLSAQGWYIVHTDRCGYNYDMHTTNNAERGMPYNYFTQGVACSEVEIDCLTGDSRVLRTDILMDLGKSINPSIDIGQIEGAFIQGFGWCTMEELIWGDKDHTWVRPGALFTRGPGTYKIPAFNDVPVDLRVHLADTDNRVCVHSSKAVGEPPFFLGCSVFFAIQDAIRAARLDNGASNTAFKLDLPATSERIRMACCDSIAQLCVPNVEGSEESKLASAEVFKTKGSW